jgi:formate--tetrahydrofolate ligase
VCARDLRAEGAMTLLLKDAIKPNLVQTLEGGPALVHCGPFGNIAHGCSSVVATKAGLGLADIVLTEAGFGADLGAEKFFDIKCRQSGLEPQAAVVVATVRALKMHGGVKKEQLGFENVGAVERGVANLRRHVQNLKRFGVPVIVAVNRFTTDTAAEIGAVRDACLLDGAAFAPCDVWGQGGEGGLALAEAVLEVLRHEPVKFTPLYDDRTGIKEKIERIAREIYGAGRVEYAPVAERALELLPKLGLGQTPICMAKTPYSFSDDPTALGAPSGFTVHVWDLIPSAGAGFVVALLGEIMTMPGLPKSPAAERMRLHPDGTIEGLF